MNALERLRAVLCTPDGEVCIRGSEGDRAIIQEALAELDTLTRPAAGDFVMVPREATPEMIVAGAKVLGASFGIQFAYTAMLSAAPQQGGQETGSHFPAKPLRVFDSGPWTWDETGQKFSGDDLDGAAYARYRDYMAGHEPQPQQPAEAVAGEFHECPHCKGWSRTPPPSTDIGKLRDAQDVIEGIKTLADGWRDLAAHIRETDKHSPVANELDNCADDVVGTIEAALIGDGGERA